MREHEKGILSGYHQSGDSRENIFISAEALEERMNNFTERRVQQNIMGQFVDSGGEIIPGKDVDAAILKTGEKVISQTDHDRSVRYISGWDLARKKTATVGITIALRDGIASVIALTRIKKWDWNIILEKIRMQQRQFPGQLVIDATGLGDVVVSQLQDLNPMSFIFSQKSKGELLSNLELFHGMKRVRYHRWELPDENGRVWSLEDELREARWDDNNTFDGVMALALALWPLYKPDIPIIKPRVGVI